jgi:hypothetical protein
MATNKLFETQVTLNNIDTAGSTLTSRVRVNREYLISDRVAGELNTYVSFDPFPTFNDLFATEYDEKTKKDISDEKGYTPGTLGVRSIFNKAGAVILGQSEATSASIIAGQASLFRISNNVPLMDNRETRRAINLYSGCTIKELVNASQKGLLGRETYSYSDFMYCRHLGKISNNYLITLRRFPYPVDDFISSYNASENQRQCVVDMFSKMGYALEVEESMMAAGTALASCGIAYAMKYIQAAASGGEGLGFDACQAQKIVEYTVRGAADLLLATGNAPQIEIDKVTTPGGMTEKGLAAMEDSGFSRAVENGLKACLK